MKCQTCGGLIIEDPGCFPNGPDRKCLMCGRRVNDSQDQKERRIMEEEKKICIKCTKEFPKTEIYFRKSRVNTDGFEGQCKKCRKKYFADYRKSKRVRSKPVKLTMDVKVKKKIPKLQPDPIKPIIKATPTEIMIALRKGFVLEVIEIIRKEFEL